MKTFEEQFLAWTDDRLPADELAAFERALAARPDADALRAEKRMALHLGNLLRENLQVPALSNPDFFNHSLLERIAAEDRAAEAAPRRGWWQWDWTPARLLAAGAACLLTALVGVRALVPTAGNGPAPQPAVALNGQPKATATPVAVAPTPEPPRGPGSANDGVVAKNDVRPPAVLTEPSPSVAPKAAAPAVTATSVHFDEGDADVIWLDGTDYLPNLDGTPAPASPR